MKRVLWVAMILGLAAGVEAAEPAEEASLAEESVRVGEPAPHDPKVQQPMEAPEPLKPKEADAPQPRPDPLAPVRPEALQPPRPGESPPLPPPAMSNPVIRPPRQWIHRAPRSVGTPGVGRNPPHFPDPMRDPRFPKTLSPDPRNDSSTRR